MTLFIAHEPRGENIDRRPLETFAHEIGTNIQAVFSREFNISQHPKEAMATAENFAARFDFAKDLVGPVGGDPIAGMILMAALVHEAIEVGASTVRSFRFIRERDPRTGERNRPKYIEIAIPTGV